jgi:hypothetical protein
MGLEKDLLQSPVAITTALLNDISTFAGAWEHFRLLEQMIQRLHHALNGDGKMSRQVIIWSTTNSKTPVATVILAETVERVHIKSVMHHVMYQSVVP